VRELNIAFRQAHHITGEVVKRAEAKSVTLEQLSLADLQAVEPRITEAARAILPVQASVASRTSFGGTAPERVRAAIAAAKKEIG